MTPHAQPRIHRDSDGSVLLEAITGIAMLAVLSAALMSFHVTAVDAAGRAEDRVSATTLVRTVLEERAALRNADAAVTDPGAVLVSATLDGGNDARCGGDPPLLAGIEVHAEEAGVLLVAPLGPQPRPAVPLGASAARTTLLLGGAGAPTVPAGVDGDLVLTIDEAGGARRHAVLSGGCTTVEALTPGRHEVALADGAGDVLIDGVQRPASHAPMTLTVLDTPVRRTWDLLPGVLVNVDAATDGARSPDWVSSGGLRWSIRGDDLRDMRELGESRLVRAGRVHAVVTACDNPEVLASSAVFELAGSGDVAVTVPLATITVQGVAAEPDARLFLVRTTGCRDGSGVLPALRWDGGLVDGMRIALPHGEWEGRLQSVTGSSLSSWVRFPAGVPDTTVSVP